MSRVAGQADHPPFLEGALGLSNSLDGRRGASHHLFVAPRKIPEVEGHNSDAVVRQGLEQLEVGSVLPLHSNRAVLPTWRESPVTSSGRARASSPLALAMAPRWMSHARTEPPPAAAAARARKSVSLPFPHVASTATSPASRTDAQSGCASAL
eukprot:CAMPEP_0180264852 /NCGR_PEP_ID=MMETSP0988-20121125/83_1 /TAXON_ID=697907 /ORGANISM="non described non described, Strain CCMP2293" /LENGTH=152 /DNA_ID=CAMNT_0022235185 /DNA_START=371 /DNA_END=825 /DNA_ORIENTATION=-